MHLMTAEQRRTLEARFNDRKEVSHSIPFVPSHLGLEESAIDAMCLAETAHPELEDEATWLIHMGKLNAFR